MTNLAPYATWAPVYRKLGFWPRPTTGKQCKVTDWQLPDDEIPAETFAIWERDWGHKNIGLHMGSPLPDGTLLGALDIDHDNYSEIAHVLLRNPPCGRIGSKGVVYFFRYPADLVTGRKIKIKGKDNKKLRNVADILTRGTICIIPPSIHPETGNPYVWTGTPLHEIDFTKLPLIGE